MNPFVTSVVAHIIRSGDSQSEEAEHILLAVAPLGPLGHNMVAVIPASVSGQSNRPRSLTSVWGEQ